MTIFTFTEARQNFSEILKKARLEGKVVVKCRDGATFEIKPIPASKSPLDVEGVDLGLSMDEIIGAIHETRKPR